MRWVPVDRIPCGPFTLDLSSRTLIMGILNVTPDSFSDGGLHFDPNRALERALQMAAEGADLIDVGGESTRPGARPVPAQEEMDRILPVIRRLAREIPVPISVDTYKAAVARAALEEGAHLVNSLSGFRYDPMMAQVVARHGVPVVITHVRGRPEDMQRDPRYESLMDEISHELQADITLGQQAGIELRRFIVDPGIGFGKTPAHNVEILSSLRELCRLNCPIMIGPSRKSFLRKILNQETGEILGASAAAIALGIHEGAHIVRVHDVALMVQVARIADALTAGQAQGALHA
ncbi:MAG TPA: dihydropteroate synthase [bacterium]|nr:dihydropteroate synthase [bacterium]